MAISSNLAACGRNTRNPRFDCTYPGVLNEVRGAISKLPETSQRNILTDNAIRFYKLR